MPRQAKICGLTTTTTVDAALVGGAAFLGFMMFPASPRNIDPAAAGRLAAPARGRAGIVAVTVDPDDALLERIAADLAPDFMQLHGRESPSRAAEIRRRYGFGLIKVLPVTESADLAAAAAYEGLVDHLMFDARAPSGSTRPGGVGARFDPAILAGRRFERPWFLAGGLDPWNVGEALRLSGAPMADVSSGVERGAGLKDPALIGAFLEAVRRA
jgi:phosphoribosylanthranilate isomerase